MSIKALAKGVVDRSRLGDQNATAEIMGVRKAAMRGVARAKLVHDAIMKYIHENPPTGPKVRPISVTNGSTIGADTVDSLTRLATILPAPMTDSQPALVGLLFALPRDGDAHLAGIAILANGPFLTDDRLIAMSQIVAEGRNRDTFIEGVKMAALIAGAKASSSLPPDAKPVYDAGRVVGAARSIQAVREGAPIAIMCPVMAWENGEDQREQPVIAKTG